MTGTGTRKRRVIIAVAFIAMLLAIAAGPSLLTWLLRKPAVPPGTVTGDDTDIRLIGIIPENGFEVFNAAGEKIGETAGFQDFGLHIDDKRFQRRLVFDTSAAGDDLCFLDYVETRPSLPKPAPWGGGTSGKRNAEHLGDHPFMDATSKKTAMRPSSLLDKIRRFFRRGRGRRQRPEYEVDSVNIEIRYWKGPPGEAVWTIDGPFEKGQVFTRAPGETDRLEILGIGERNGAWGTKVLLKLPDGANYPSTFLAYDSGGGRVRPEHFSASSGKPTGFIVPGLKPSEISRFTWGEKPLEKTFHNVRFRLDTVAAPLQDYFNELARRVPGLDPSQGDLQLGSGDEAMAIVDIVRGGHVWKVANHLTSQRNGLDFASLGDAEREKLSTACRNWWNSWDPRVRVFAVRVGVFLDRDLYMPRAFELLRHGDRFVREHAAMIFHNRRINLNAREIESACEALAVTRTPIIVEWLTAAVLRSTDPAVGGALAKLAAGDRPWLWWPALEDERTLEALGPREHWSRAIRTRHAIVSGFDDSLDCDEATRTEALALLESAITYEFANLSPEAFMSAARTALAKLDAASADRLAIEFCERAYMLERDSHAVIPFVEHLNDTHNIEIGSLGVGISDRLYYLYDGPQMADDVLQWHATGTVPRDVPEGYRAGADDLRVILYDSREPEKSLVGLWIYLDGLLERPRRYVLKAGDRLFRYAIEVGRSPTPQRMVVNARVVLEGKGFTQANESFNGSDLPLEVPVTRFDLDLVVEKADDPKSVLAGTKVFEDWWEKYGPEGVEPQGP